MPRQEQVNSEQRRHWNELAGPRWVAHQAELDVQLRPYGEAIIERAGLATAAAGRVLDVGCGCGGFTLDLARRQAELGRADVAGVDISAPMIEQACRTATAAGLDVRFFVGDAQSDDLGAAAYDVLVSRFGVMFFADPAAALENLGRCLRPGGRLVFACWQEEVKNLWITVPAAAVNTLVPLPAPPPAPHSPGMFAFADEAYLRGLLTGAGFHDISLEPRTQPIVPAGRTVQRIAEVILDLSPPVVAAVAQSGDPELPGRVLEALTAAVRPFERGGIVEMPAAAWIVSARR